MKILITGASGYLGSQLVKALADDKNNKIIAVVRPSSSTSRLSNLSISLVKADNDKQLDDIFSLYLPDIVINTVALYGRQGESISSLIDANISYPSQLLSLAKKYNAKAFIHTGTSLPDDISAYALTKNTFVKLAAFQDLASTQFINLELEHFYGPGDDDSKFISYVIRECLANRSLNLTTGTQRRDFIYIDDVISAYKTILDKLSIFGAFDTISVGSGEAPMVRELVEVIHSSAGSNAELKFGAKAMRDNELMYSCSDNEKLYSLGWHIEYPMKNGIQLTVRNFNAR